MSKVTYLFSFPNSIDFHGKRHLKIAYDKLCQFI